MRRKKEGEKWRRNGGREKRVWWEIEERKEMEKKRNEERGKEGREKGFGKLPKDF